MGERIRLDNLVLYAKNEDGTYTKVGDVNGASMTIDHYRDVAKINCDCYLESIYKCDNKKYDIKEHKAFDINDYIAADIANTYAVAIRNVCGIDQHARNKISRVIFNAPATIVIWGDGSKTVVKCGKDECYDPEKGLAMAISKRFLGDKGNYYEEFKKWLPKKDPLADFAEKVRFFAKWGKEHIPEFGRR